ncbi:hypothetical protein LTSEMIS_2243 [Salmonella enterica subsp. enterica serovar Mississippi str. A4-633]|nr:hypothetical protein LTSEMIS_2243 [Salmonella enterica subsp. enterica serovar Mississippi str. A4-633]
MKMSCLTEIIFMKIFMKMPDKCKRINGKRDIKGSQYVKF